MTHFLGLSLISWSTKKQNSVALSTAEAEYVAAGSCCAQLLWIKQQLIDFGIDVRCVTIFTKALSREHFERNRLNLGMIKIA